jgi:hypothetical protein
MLENLSLPNFSEIKLKIIEDAMELDDFKNAIIFRDQEGFMREHLRVDEPELLFSFQYIKTLFHTLNPESIRYQFSYQAQIMPMKKMSSLLLKERPRYQWI